MPRSSGETGEGLRRSVGRLGLEVLGWLLVLAGLAGILLPGPGVLLLALGLWVHARHYRWAARLVDPVRRAARRAVEASVKSVPRVAVAAALSLGLVAAGLAWGIRPGAPRGGRSRTTGGSPAAGPPVARSSSAVPSRSGRWAGVFCNERVEANLATRHLVDGPAQTPASAAGEADAGRQQCRLCGTRSRRVPGPGHTDVRGATSRRRDHNPSHRVALVTLPGERLC